MGRSPKITILIHEFVTGGGLAGEPIPPSWAAEGRAMRRALAEDFASLNGIDVVMTLDASLPDEPGPWRVVRIGPGEELDAFARLASECDYTLCVAPETGGVLEERARIIERVGGKSLGCAPDAIALCADKIRLGAHLRERGIATPDCVRVIPSQGLPRDFPYPAVLKPIDGAGSLDTYYIESADAVPEAAKTMPEAVLQPFVAGMPMSVSFLLGPATRPLVMGFADQIIERIDGKLSYRGGRAPSETAGLTSGSFPTRRHDERCLPLLDALRSVPGLFGWVGVDFIWDDAAEQIIVIEINPRATTSIVGFRAVAPPHTERSSWLARAWMMQMRRGEAKVPYAYVSSILMTFTPEGKIHRVPDAPTPPLILTGRARLGHRPKTRCNHRSLALDVGGANLKAATSRGVFRSAPFALWKHPEDLGRALVDLVVDLPPCDRIAVTMTGELCDCFATKAVGVKHILDSVVSVFEERKVCVWTSDRRLVSVAHARDHPHLVAAANWLALATWVARSQRDGLMIDIGSTTADIIAMKDGKPIPQGRTDTARLQSGELVYAGVKRTPVCALATALPHRGVLTGLAAELFATTRDVYLMLGDIRDDPNDLDTADGRPATAEFARDRLARMVGEDREGFTREDAIAFAKHADEALMDRLAAAADRVARDGLGGAPERVMVSGSGEFLAERVAKRVLATGGSTITMSEFFGRDASDAACALALAKLASATGEEEWRADERS